MVAASQSMPGQSRLRSSRPSVLPIQSAAASFLSIVFSSGVWLRAHGEKQPFAIAMKDRTLFALGGFWENWRDPQSGDWIRTIAIITVPSNELVAQIHARMKLILPKNAYERWLGGEPDPHDLLVPFPADLMVMWPVSTRVNRPDNDDASLLEPATQFRLWLELHRPQNPSISLEHRFGR
jgi:hypothetical protein